VDYEFTNDFSSMEPISERPRESSYNTLLLHWYKVKAKQRVQR